MRVLITGGAGFIGAHSARALLSAGHEVYLVDDLSHGKREAVPPGAALEVLDVRDPRLLQWMEQNRPEAVLHLAAQMDVRKSVADPAWDASVNVLGTVNVLEAARRAGVRRFVLASSGGAVYGEQESFPASESHPRRPASPYGVSKLCAEEYVAHFARAHGLSALSLRYANVYGPRCRSSTATDCRPAITCMSRTWPAPTCSRWNRSRRGRSTSAPGASATW